MEHGQVPNESQRGPRLSEAVEFRVFYEETYPIVYGYFYVRCGYSPDTAMDLAQDTFQSLLSALDDGANLHSPKAWLMTVAKRRLVDHYRKNSRPPATSLENIAEPADPGPGSTSLLEVSIASALSRLPSRERAAVVLRYMDGMSVSEVAEALGVSYRATESLLARGRRRLAQAVETSEVEL